MDPQAQFCPHHNCPKRGVLGEGNIGIHSRKEERYIGHHCGQTFAATTGTPFYRRRYEASFISQMLSLLAHGCPPQAIVATFEVDERTLGDWQRDAGAHGQPVPQAQVQQGALDLGQVQADELRVRTQRGIVWVALAIAVTRRLWWGGVVSATRDTSLALGLALQVKACALCRPLLIGFDGFKGYVKAFRRAFREPLRTGQVGRPRLIPWPALALGQGVKQYVRRRVVGIEQRLLQGGQVLVAGLLQASQGGGVLNTAYIERLNATFRAGLACLVRRGRALARTAATVEAGMDLLGCVYHFCTWHERLRQPAAGGSSRRWEPQTPAMAAGLTDHRWTVLEWLSFKVPPPPYAPPKRRGRRPKALAGAGAT